MLFIVRNEIKSCTILFFYALCLYGFQSWVSTGLLFCAVFVFLATDTKMISASKSIAWSLIAALIAMAPCFFALEALGTMSSWISIVILLFYAMVIVSSCVFVTRLLVRVITTPCVQLISLSIVMTLWWYVFFNFFFKGLGINCGYMCAHPFLSCVQSSFFCSLCACLGLHITFFFFILVCGGVVYGYIYRSSFFVYIAIVLLGVGLSKYKKSTPFPFSQLPYCVAVTPMPPQSNLLDVLHSLHYQWNYWCCDQSLHIPDIILGYESCVPGDLGDIKAYVDSCDCYGSKQSPYVCIGVYRKEGTKRYKSLVLIHQGRIIYNYDKEFLLPFLETPYENPFHIPYLQGLLLSQGESVCAQPLPSDSCKLAIKKNTYTFFGALCADFFCTDIRPPLGEQPLLIVLVNDAWCEYYAVAKTLFFYAVLWSVTHRTPVLYGGRLIAAWIEPSGNVTYLSRAER